MPSMPKNLVKAPPASAFDNPLRRTTPVETAEPAPVLAQAVEAKDDIKRTPNTVVAEADSGVVVPIAGDARTVNELDSEKDSMSHRITVRIDDATRRTLEAESHKRRLAGEKTNVADLARNVLKQWAGRANRAR